MNDLYEYPKRIEMKTITSIVLLLLVSCCAYGQEAPIDTSKVVDYHVHIFSPELVDNCYAQGFDFMSSGFQVINTREAYANIKTISQNNQQAKMLLISTAYAYENIAEGLSKQAFVQRENNLLAELVKTDPERLLGFYGIDPLQDFALEEIKRCDEVLQLDGLKLHLQANNLQLQDSVQLAKLKAIFQLADERNIPMLIHNNAWVETSGASYFEIFKKELLDPYDSLTIIFAHGGGGGGIYQFALDFLEGFKTYFQEPQYQHKIYFELSSVAKILKLPGAQPDASYLSLMQEIGYDKFLFGSDYPVRNTPTYRNECFKLLKIPPAFFKQICENDLFDILKREHH